VEPCRAALARPRRALPPQTADRSFFNGLLGRLDGESEKLRQEEDVLRRQQQKTKADIGRLVEVLKSTGAKGLPSVQAELTRLEAEDSGLTRQLRELAKRQEPLSRITDDAKAFIQNWADVGELLDVATEEEKTQLIRHYVEVVELHAADAKGETGTYAMRLFPEIRPDRGFDWGETSPETPPDDGSPIHETTNGDDFSKEATAASLTDSRLVCISDGKAPRVTQHTHHGLVELGAYYALNTLRRSPTAELYPWNAVTSTQKQRRDPGKPVRDPLRLTRYYQSLLDTGKFESRAALARFLGVRRARVTQVLNRLKSPLDTSEPRSSSSEGTSDVA
jgi:hypothetical protein